MNLKTVKIIDYQIISDSNYAIVRREIKKLIDLNEGWQPYGLLLTNMVRLDTIIYTQSMAKYIPELFPEDN